MLIAVLLIMLIAVILFREELRVLIGLGTLVFLIVAFWNSDVWWGKPASIGLVALAVLAIIGGMIKGWHEDRIQDQRTALAEPQQATAPAHVAPAPYAGLTMDNGWFCLVDGREYGPMNKDRLIDLLARGEIPPDTPVKCLNSPWQPANQVISFTKR